MIWSISQTCALVLTKITRRLGNSLLLWNVFFLLMTLFDEFHHISHLVEHAEVSSLEKFQIGFFWLAIEYRLAIMETLTLPGEQISPVVQ